MRLILAFGLAILLSACSGDPRAFGITGPGVQTGLVAPPDGSPDAVPTPGIPASGTSYGPTTRPTTGDSGFWGYN